MFLWLAEVFTQIAVNIFNFLLILVVFNLTKSNTAVALVVLSFTLPAVFLGVLAGVYTDKWSKKNVLFASNILRALSLLILLFFSGNIFVIYLISIVFGIITQFFIPAETPLIPVIVKKDELLSANALFGIGLFGSILAAYLITGPMLLYIGFEKTLLFIIIFLIIGGFLISQIKVPISEEKKQFIIFGTLPWKEIKSELFEVVGIIQTKKHILSSLILLALSQILVLIIASVAPGFANEVLHIKVVQFPLLVITPAILGIVTGAILIADRLHKKRKKDIVTAGIFLSGLALFAMPYGDKIASNQIFTLTNNIFPDFLYINHIDVIILLAFILGLANALVFVPANTFLQEATSDEMRGKIYGVLNTFVGIFSFSPILLVGSFSDLIGVGRVVTIIGLSLLVVSIGKLSFSKSL